MELLYRASKWAKNKPLTSRLIIALATILSVIIHYYAGLLLFAEGLHIPFALALVISLISMTAILVYPKGKRFKQQGSRNFRKRKVLDFLIFTCGAILVIYLANRRAYEIWHDPELRDSVEQIAESPETQANFHLISSKHPVNTATPAEKFSRKEIRKMLKKQIKELRQYIKAELKALKARRKKGEKTNTAAKILLTLFTIVLALGLGYLVVALACSVSCNGNETLGAVILIVGWAGIIFLSFLAIQKIFSRDPRPKAPRPKDSNYPY